MAQIQVPNNPQSMFVPGKALLIFYPGRDPNAEYWYRAEASFACCHTINVHACQVLRRTPHGVWVADTLSHLEETLSLSRNHFIRLDSRKKYAQPTIKEALESFAARKKKQLAIFAKQMDKVNTLLLTAEVLILRQPEKDAAQRLKETVE